MKLRVLIEHLEQLKAKHGDLDVVKYTVVGPIDSVNEARVPRLAYIRPQTKRETYIKVRGYHEPVDMVNDKRVVLL